MTPHNMPAKRQHEPLAAVTPTCFPPSLADTALSSIHTGVRPPHPPSAGVMPLRIGSNLPVPWPQALGRLEVRRSGWVAICADGFRNAEAQVMNHDVMGFRGDAHW